MNCMYRRGHGLSSVAHTLMRHMNDVRRWMARLWAMSERLRHRRAGTPDALVADTHTAIVAIEGVPVGK
ncbi:hypothetical protein GALL_407380 [mine drainage metagenome]|uniref:Uncharacterized protein n=1 Tax=mine drainage metagenome TaxID=410659 RepID=A0A1J5Q1L5_9ZZZZ